MYPKPSPALSSKRPPCSLALADGVDSPPPESQAAMRSRHSVAVACATPHLRPGLDCAIAPLPLTIGLRPESRHQTAPPSPSSRRSTSLIVGLASGLMAQHSRTSVARAGGHSAWVLTWLGLGLGLGLGLELGLGSGSELGLGTRRGSRPLSCSGSPRRRSSTW